ncbi:hypothetical protein [Mediterranea massiliensis]|uniref:hypothetical protein n=1 Tax=Mediterranea massiliensis TaxID=1841865 RepID=UPI00320A1D9F
MSEGHEALYQNPWQNIVRQPDNPTTHLPKANRHDCPLAAVAALYGIGTLFV